MLKVYPKLTHLWLYYVTRDSLPKILQMREEISWGMVVGQAYGAITLGVIICLVERLFGNPWWTVLISIVEERLNMNENTYFLKTVVDSSQVCFSLLSALLHLRNN